MFSPIHLSDTMKTLIQYNNSGRHCQPNERLYIPAYPFVYQSIRRYHADIPNDRCLQNCRYVV
ncbi:hypothetical protein ALPO108162_15150 [Alicyclobacillus pomorum]|jgi:hypothetical protein